MTAVTSSQRSRGMRDLLPDELARMRAVERTFLLACDAWGYREVRTPVIEPLHLFTAAGTLSPQTLDRVYSFLDWDGWSGERVVLRPDSTIPAARLYAEHLDGGATARLCYSQDVFRFTDDGSSREEWQCGVELIGDSGAVGDVELVLLALDVLARLDAPTPVVRLSHAGIVRGVLAAAGLDAEAQSATYDRLLDGDLAVVDEVESRMPEANAALRMLFEVEGAGAGYLANLRPLLAGALPALTPVLDELTVVVEALEARGVRPVVQAVLARRFEYYSGMVMRVECGGERVCSGGRYDGLLALVGDTNVPASGFAVHVEPLSRLVAAPATSTERQIVVAAGDSASGSVALAHEAATTVRAAGMRAVAASDREAAVADVVVRTGSPRYLVRTAGNELTLDFIDDVIGALDRAEREPA